MSKVRKMADLVVAPGDMAEAAQFLERIGIAQRRCAAIQAELDTHVAQRKREAEALVAPLATEITQLTDGLHLWAAANRKVLTREGATKTVRLATGEVAWRDRPPAARVRDIAAALEFSRTKVLVQFIRVKEELDKAAMLREPVLAVTVPGVTIAGVGEEFIVAPTEMPLAGAPT